MTAHTQRKRWLWRLLLATLLVAAIAGSYWWFIGSRLVLTDNAYTATEVAQVAAAVDGTVRHIHTTDTQKVQADEVLVELDPTDARLALIEAEAELNQAARRVEGYFLNDQILAAQEQARDADLKRVAAQLAAAQADRDRASLDLKRRRALAVSGSVSADELSRAENANLTAQASVAAAHADVALAQANLSASLGTRRMNQALIEGTTLDTHPEVLLARAKKDQARLNLDRTVIRAPVAGVVVKRQVQLGQRVHAGLPLLSIVPTDKIYVNANFKEVQLAHVKIGHPVELTSDWYGSAVKYQGTVAGFSGGSGASFAVIPAQNATGNWIKVVQRVPVRISLDPAQLQQHPLGVGLSMTVRIRLDRP